MTTYLESLVGWWWLPIWNHQSILRVEERTTIRYPTLGFKSLLYPPKVFERLEGWLFTGDGFSDRLLVSDKILAMRFESSSNLYLRLCWNNDEMASDSIKQSGFWLLTITVVLSLLPIWKDGGFESDYLFGTLKDLKNRVSTQIDYYLL